MKTANGLYQVPLTLTLQEKVAQIKNQLVRGSPINDQHMQNLLGFIAGFKFYRFYSKIEE
jgi:hypothetical protein